MRRLSATRTMHLSCILILCFCCFHLEAWINMAKYNLSNFLKPIFYLRVDGGKNDWIKSFEKNTICNERNVSLSKTALPLTGLVSFPGSGNTWTRHLIQQMTGIGTSSVYCDGSLKKRGFPYECYHKLRNKTVVIKAHVPEHLPLFTKIIFLIRNPYDAFLSFANYKEAGHTEHPTEGKLKKSLTKTVESSGRNYVNLARNITLQFKGPVHVLQYEKLKTDMANELRKLAKFLGVNVTKHDIYCTVKLQEGNFHRNTTDEKHIKLLQRMYDKENLLKIQEITRYTEKLFKEAYDLGVDLKGPEDQLFQ
ncbi:WSC domain-containing protein 1-like [Mercenaria mercenaria]|uniref:WSC domain-containing protein 1-like n=1 Tax=Mercenaria mercenaria TaxID=6596 RepID=UPI00234F67AF|nr:WSC domain-containing protein 1-like [Mercenaria mercenaria]